MATVEIDGVSKAIYKLNLAESGIALQRFMPELPAAESNNNSIESNGDGDNDDGMDVDENGGESTAGGVNDMVDN